MPDGTLRRYSLICHYDSLITAAGHLLIKSITEKSGGDIPFKSAKKEPKTLVNKGFSAQNPFWKIRGKREERKEDVEICFRANFVRHFSLFSFIFSLRRSLKGTASYTPYKTASPFSIWPIDRNCI